MKSVCISTSINKYYNDIISNSSSCSWAVFGYSAEAENALECHASGTGSLAEMVDEFEDSKVQYAFARYTDPDTRIAKFVFVSWCPEGVPFERRSVFNSHLASVGQFLKGFHVQINARDRDDVDPEVIKKKIRQSAGSVYTGNSKGVESGFKQRLREEKVEGGYAPQLQRNQQRPEESRAEMAAAEKWNPFSAEGAKPAGIKQQNAASGKRGSAAPFINWIKPEAAISRKVDIKPEAVVSRKVEVKPEAANIDSLEGLRTSGSVSAARNFFKQKELEGEAIRSSGAGKGMDRASVLAAASGFQEESLGKMKKSPTRQQPAEDKSKDIQQPAEEAASIKWRAIYDYEPSDPETELQLIAGLTLLNVKETEDQQWLFGQTVEGKSGIFPSSYVEAEELVKTDKEDAGSEEEAIFHPKNEAGSLENSSVSVSSMDLQNTESAGKVGSGLDMAGYETVDQTAGCSIKCVALYDYTAADENEISFMEGSEITNVVMEEEEADWWFGRLGEAEGYFPASYVRLVDGME